MPLVPTGGITGEALIIVVALASKFTVDASAATGADVLSLRLGHSCFHKVLIVDGVHCEKLCVLVSMVSMSEPIC